MIKINIEVFINHLCHLSLWPSNPRMPFSKEPPVSQNFTMQASKSRKLSQQNQGKKCYPLIRKQCCSSAPCLLFPQLACEVHSVCRLKNASGDCNCDCFSLLPLYYAAWFYTQLFALVTSCSNNRGTSLNGSHGMSSKSQANADCLTEIESKTSNF